MVSAATTGSSSSRLRWLAVAVAGLLCASASPDTVVLKNGKTVEGEVVSEEETEIVVKTATGHRIIKMAEVKEIRKSSGEGTPPAGAGKRKAEPAQEPPNPAATKEGRAALIGVDKLHDINEKPVSCPRCKGTGIAVTLPCLNCNKSGKPGYKNVGYEYQVCPRCGGTAIAAQYKCGLCLGEGRVYLSHLIPADGGRKKSPVNFIYCDQCNGTGVEIWETCHQCERSKWPGYLFHGESLTLCNRCNGKTKVAALMCAKCRGKGLLPLQGEGSKQFTQPSQAETRK